MFSEINNPSLARAPGGKEIVGTDIVAIVFLEDKGKLCYAECLL
jgi:hypothetical protein